METAAAHWALRIMPRIPKRYTHAPGRGVWYAVIEAEQPDVSDHDVVHIDEIAHEKCNGRKAAATVARRLLKEHVNSVDEMRMIRSALYSELEWDPPKQSR